VQFRFPELLVVTDTRHFRVFYQRTSDIAFKQLQVSLLAIRYLRSMCAD
jgi:hypothetical protein